MRLCVIVCACLSEWDCGCLWVCLFVCVCERWFGVCGVERLCVILCDIV